MYWTLGILGIIFIGFVVYMVIKESSSAFNHKPKPDASTGYKPSIRPAAQKTTPDMLLTFKGEGSRRTDSFYLDCAIYRIEYQLPPTAKVRIELVTSDGGTRKLLANKAGFDSSTFNAPVAKYYVLDIKTEAEDTQWAVVIKPF